jgi:lipopolysaccharide export LptBFGC system permease protein LptF
MYIQHSKDYRGRRELSLKGIKERIEKIKKEGKLTQYRKRKINALLVEYHKRLAIPFASIVFIVIGCPCAIKVRRKGAGFGIALIFFIFFYICLVAGEHIGAKGIVIPWLAIWFPNILVGIGGVILNFQFMRR